MSIKSRYNFPQIGQAAESIAALFAPPSGAEAASWADANAKNAEARRIADYYSGAATMAPDVFDRQGIALNLFDPAQGYGMTTRGQDIDSADARYGHDATAATSRTNNAAGNARALADRRLQEEGLLTRQFAEPVKAAQGETVFLPNQTAAATGLAPTLAGAPKALSESEALAEIIMRQDPGTQNQFVTDRFSPTESQVQGQERRRLAADGMLDDQALLDTITGAEAPVQAIGPDGKTPMFMSPGEAARTGAQPYDRGPATVINNGPNGVPYGEPEKGTVWARNPDNTVKLDERGAPIAIPYQGGSIYQAQEAAAAARANRGDSDETKQNIVLQDIDRALGRISENPMLTTGVGAQLTAGIGGTPAYDTTALIDTVRANIGFDQLQAMRDASPTGGALGNVTERETALLQALLGNLQPGQGTAQLTDNLKRLKNQFLDIVHGPGQGPERERLSFDQPSAPQGASAGEPVRVTSPEEARQLPSGTQIVLPDGSLGRVP